jgi:hypothetical protein
MLLIRLLHTLLTPETIQQVTREILSRSEFQSAPTTGTWWYTLGEWFVRTFEALVHWSQAHPIARWVMVGLLSLLCLLILVHLMTLVRQDMSPHRHPHHMPSAASTAAWNTSSHLVPPWDTLRHEVGTALRQGDGYRAIWILHRLLVGMLAQQGVLRHASWKTNADYVRECPRSHAAYATLVDVTRAYEQIVYAHRPLPLVRLSALLAQVEHVVRNTP